MPVVVELPERTPETSMDRTFVPDDLFHAFTSRFFAKHDETLERAVRKAMADATVIDKNSSASERLASLGVVMALAAPLSTSDIAVLLGTDRATLRRWVHGVTLIPPQKTRRLRLVTEVLLHVGGVVEPTGIPRWFRLQIPALNNKTPLQAFLKGKASDVLKVARSYSDPSFA